jgi:hypothetical protein
VKSAVGTLMFDRNSQSKASQIGAIQSVILSRSLNLR